MHDLYYQSLTSFCDRQRVDAQGIKFRCKNSYLNSYTHLCKSCTEEARNGR